MIQLQKIDTAYRDIFGEGLGTYRLEEINDLLADCASMADVEALADCDDATISYGEFQAISDTIEGQPNSWNIT